MQTLDVIGRTRALAAGRSSGSLLVSLMVLGWSIKYLVTLALGHTTGPELYGVLTAAIAVGTSAGTLALVRKDRPYVALTAAVLALWALVALAGVAGTVAHVIGPVAGHGLVDPRPRPISAPLVFTILAVFGGGAVVRAQHVVGRLRSIRYS